MKLKYIPNVLSVIRIILVFVFAWLFFWNYPDNTGLALLVFILAGATDVIDGYLARRFKWITNLGKVLDPLADKLMQCTVLICLSIKSLIPWWLAAFYILKELLMGIGGLFVFKRKDVIVVSNKYGKAAVCVFYAAMFFIILFKETFEKMPMLIDAISIVTLSTAIFAISMYYIEYVKNTRTIKEAKQKGNSK